MKLNFRGSRLFTLGAELELQIVDCESMALSSSSPQILELTNDPEGIVAELYQSMIEVKTGIYTNAFDAGMDLQLKVHKIQVACKKLGLDVISAGLHPWSSFSDVKVFPSARYKQILDSRRWIAKKMLVSGLHVHIGMESGDQAVRISNVLVEFLPMLLALSSSSPFDEGLDTGLNSARSTVFESIPTGGLPDSFDSWAEFESAHSGLLRNKAIESVKDLWWDIRPSPSFGTLEFRICDAPSTILETSALIALVHLLCFHVESEFARGLDRVVPPRWIVRENKWRALRDGVRGEFISSCGTRTESLALLFSRIVDETGPWIKIFNYEEQIETLYRILKYGSSADRQRRVFRESGESLHAVVSALVSELESDQPGWLGAGKIWQGNIKNKKGQNECA